MFSEDILLENHLLYDVYPPIESGILETAMKFCKQAIKACENGESGRRIALPSGAVQTAGELVDGLNLGGFVEMRLQKEA